MPLSTEPAVPAPATPGAPVPASALARLVRGEVAAGGFPAFVVVAAELAIFVWLTFRLNLETTAFRNVVVLAAGGFLVHHFLPRRLQLPWFFALSCGGLLWVLGTVPTGFDLGTGLQRAAAVLGAGGALIGVCHLPLKPGIRALLLLLSGGAIALFVAGVLPAGPLAAVLPILGSLFALRVIVYFYDVTHGVEGQGPWRPLSYFFLLPNIVFPLFPVVDYKTFCKTHFDAPAFPIYQRGIHWMMRGVVQLALGRILYYQVYLDPSRVTDGADLARYCFSNFGLYLKVSGTFHLSIGLLHLFGFHLPETNHNYFLASSFTDLWRRTNIYWKDFMTKVFYYPTVMRVKSWGPTRSMVAGTLVVFLVTWFLHSYQTFWLRGSAPHRVQDDLMWGLLGVFVMRDSLREAALGRTRALGQKRMTVREIRTRLLKTAATYLTLVALWSLWTADSMKQWFGLLRYADGTFWLCTAGATITVMAAVLVLEIKPWQAPAPSGLLGRKPLAPPDAATFMSLRPVVSQCLVPAIALVGVTSAPFAAALDDNWSEIVRSVKRTGPNKSDEELMVRNYYEDVMDVSRSNVALQDQRPAGWQLLENSAAVRMLGDLRQKELVPGKTTTVNGHRVTANRWGMRDQDYELRAPPGTVRLALLGSSVAMGWGVENGETFESLAEARLNGELSPKTGSRYEILNFAVNGYDQLSQLFTLREKVSQFQPDALVLLAHREDVYFVKHDFAKALRKQLRLPSEALLGVAQRAGISSKTPELEGERRLARYWPDLLEFAYSEITAWCRARGIRAYFWMLPGVLKQGLSADDLKMIELARKAGFVTATLSPDYGDQDRSKLVVGSWDAHPNAAAHRLIARAFYDELLRSNVTQITRRADAATAPATVPSGG